MRRSPHGAHGSASRSGHSSLVGNPDVYTVYALDEEISGTARTTLGDVSVQMEGHILDQAELEVLRAESSGRSGPTGAD